METVQVVLDARLLEQVDRAARSLKLNRSAFFRAALRSHLAELERLRREESDRRGYERAPDRDPELTGFIAAAKWPEDD